MSTTPFRVGVIGYGYWGPNLVRAFNETPGIRVTWVSDMQQARLDQLLSRYPNTKTSKDQNELIKSGDVDAVAIATPVSTHFPIAKAAIEAGLHVWVEKPLCGSSDQAATLCKIAEKAGIKLFVDHTFVYTGAVRKIREIIASGALGDIYYYDSVRVNLGLFQHDVNVIWDLAVHDLAIIDSIFPHQPTAVSATGISHIAGQVENVAYITLFYPDRQLAHVHVNWLAPVKVRQTLIGGSQRMIVYDDVEPSEKVKIYDKGVAVHAGTELRREMMINYRSGDMWAPRIDTTEALQVAAKAFLKWVQLDEKPLTDGLCGLRIVRSLEAIERSVRARGQLIELKEEVIA